MPQPSTFGPFQIDPARTSLKRDGTPVALGGRALAVLCSLVAAQGRVVPKDALMDAAWPGQAVEDANLTVQIAALRKALGRRPDGQEWILTLARVGYRLAMDPEPQSALPETEVIRLIVRPFETEDADYFARGVVHDIVAALARFRTFVVLAPQGQTPEALGAAAAVHPPLFDGPTFILQGSAQRAGDRLRLVATLQEAGTGRVLWAQRFDGKLSDVFDFQDEITETVAARIEPQIERAAVARSRRKAPGNLTAHDFYLQALPHLHAETEAGNREAYRLLERALELDSSNAIYLVHAVWTLEHRLSAAWEPLAPDDAARCLDLAAQAQARADGDAVVLALCAMAQLHVGKDYSLALDLSRTARTANPNSIRALLASGVAELHCGDLASTLDLMDRAQALSPDDPLIHIAHCGGANAHLILGDFDLAARAAARAMAVNPSFDAAYWIMAAALAHQGRLTEAAAAVQRLRALTPGVSITRIRTAQPCRFPERLDILLDGLRKAGLPET